MAILLILVTQESKAQGGISGYVYNTDGEPLPFATIYVKQNETGTTTNIEGFFSLALAKGSYNLVFQYLGYAAEEKTINVGDTYQQFDITLSPEALLLQEVEISAKMEDPAYTIMRKAIAKSKFHLQQIDSYSARVYIKGSGRLVDSPFFLRKALAKEGIDSSFTYVSESISEISYERPNTFSERVISVRSNGDDYDTSPNGYIMGSFYEPTIAEAISPLSPKAFGYYKFEYLGTFIDRDFAVSKIRVIPRSKGDDVFAGIINIVEDYWSIYSLNLNTSKLGINFNVQQIYNPINDIAWLPVSHQFAVAGKFLGFDFEYDYLATVSNYEVTLNPDLNLDLTVIDEKVEQELAKELSQLPRNNDATTQEKLASGKDLTRKELRKLINAYEKEELKASDEPKVLENYSYTIDSLAANSDSAFWESVRPVPLTARELTGYRKMDSLAIVERAEVEGDTLKKGKRKGFHIQDIVLGNSYRFKKKGYLRYYSPLASLNFNTVEGYNFNTRFRYVKSWQEANRRIEVMPIFRYSFSRGRLTGKATVKYSYGRKSLRGGSFSLSGGKFVKQYNSQNPIHPLVNSITTLLFKNNYMKLYEEGYISLAHSGKLADNLSYDLVATWSERTNLANTTDHTWIQKSQEYTPNNPANAELSDTSFPFHQSLVGEASLRYQPWLRYRIRYGRKRAIKSSSPTFTLLYRKGFSNAIGDTDFDYLETGFNHNFKIGVRGKLGFDITAGKFLNSKNLYFMDFSHFMGNETPLLLNNPVGSYRLLSYYQYSTADQFFSGITHYQFRKFLFTQLPLLRMTGVKEIVFLSYLATPYSNNYFEVGYGIDNLFRVLRLEAAAAFQDGRYIGFGLRVGIATSIGIEGNTISFGF
jgi:ribosomal protein L19